MKPLLATIGVGFTLAFFATSSFGQFLSVAPHLDPHASGLSPHAKAPLGYIPSILPSPLGPPARCECPPGATLEGEPCAIDGSVDTVNGGCNVSPPVFTPIAHGETVCGEASTFTNAGVGDLRDTDWYGPIVLPEPGRIRWTVAANFPAALLVFRDLNPGSPCQTLQNVGGQASFSVGCGFPSSYEATVPAGTYYTFVAPNAFGDGADCGVAGTSYVATLEILAPVPPPDPCVCPPNATVEGEVCATDDYVDTVNGGCNAVLPAFTPIADGQTICGEAASFHSGGANFRDTDWFGPIDVAEITTLAWQVQANFDAVIVIIQDQNPPGTPCFDGSLLLFMATGLTTTDCQPTTIEASVGPGRYYSVIVPKSFGSGADCGVDGTSYVARLNVGAPALLTRADAVDALLDPGSGVVIDAAHSAVWSPFVDFNAGAGYEGLLPAGSAVDPYTLGESPFPGPGMAVVSDSYFFWIDDMPSALFQHPVRFALMDANNPNPTVDNGGIQVSAQGWWPVVTLLGPALQAFFDTIDSRVTANPPGFDNPEGLVAGTAASPNDIVVLPPPTVVLESGGANACGLILRGSAGTVFRNDVTRFETDLRNRFNVPAGRIVKVNGGNPATKTQLKTAIEGDPNAPTAPAICTMNPPCDKIYVRMSSHGSVGSYCLADGSITKADLCKEFQKLAAKGVPICLVINGCHTGSLLDAHDWNFPAGSSIITAADAAHSSYGNVATTAFGTNANITESFYPHAFSVCLNNNAADSNDPGTDVDDCEAHAWILQQTPLPCYTAHDGNFYPAGPSPGTPGINPNPQKRTVGRDPKAVNINVRNATGAAKTDFHFIFQGNVAGGFQHAWRSTANDVIGERWAENGETVTFDEEKMETMVCWENPKDPVQPGDYIHFGYSAPTGKVLRPMRQFWTPTPQPQGAPADRTPSRQSTIQETVVGQELVIRTISRSEEFGGTDADITVDFFFRVSPEELELEDLNLGFLENSGITPNFLGSFTLAPDISEEFVLQIPEDIGPLDTLILESVSSWDLNGNTTTELFQFDPVASVDGPFSLTIGDDTAVGLNPANLPVTMTNPDPVQGFVLAIGYDAGLLSVVDVSVAGTITEATGAELVIPEIFETQGGFTLGVVLDFNAPFDGQEIPAGNEQPIATFTAVANVLVPSATDVDLAFQDGVFDTPPVDNLLQVGGLSLGATEGLELNRGVLTVVPPLSLILRGDCDANGQTNGLVDGLLVLGVQFQSLLTPCLAACDADGDRVFNGLQDALYLLGCVFLQGPCPPPPWPDCGPDPNGFEVFGCDAPPDACN